MPNVKPGDLARCIHDPDTNRGGSNVGKQCYVISPAETQSLGWIDQLLVAATTQTHGQLWAVETLESWWSVDGIASQRRTLQHPGSKFMVPDRFLERIEPPSDASDLYLERPFSDEEQPLKEPSCSEPSALAAR